MNHTISLSTTRAFLGLAAVLTLSGAVLAATPSERVLHSFKGGNDGAFPSAELVADKDGNLYGTTVYGGIGQCTDSAGFVIGCGTVFKLTKPSVAGGEWKETILYSFLGPSQLGYETAYPSAGLVMDAAENLYGTTAGQSSDHGTVFELIRPLTGDQWKKKSLYRFLGANDGANPMTHLVWDKQGRLYGTTSNGQGYNGGTVFRLSPGANRWTEEVLYAFSGGTDGYVPNAVRLGGDGHVFGTTSIGGGFGFGDQYFPSWPGGGLFFELSPGRPGRMWREKQLLIFQTCSTDQGTVSCGYNTQPFSNLWQDANGILYGTAQLGYDANSVINCAGFKDSSVGCGAVYQLVPPSIPGGAWAQNIIYGFGSSALDGAFPVAGLVADLSGNLYGTDVGGLTDYGYSSSLGTVYKLSPPAGGAGPWTETILHNFEGGSDGIYPSGAVIFGPTDGALYGTTQYGGASNCIHTTRQPTGCGTVYAVVP